MRFAVILPAAGRSRRFALSSTEGSIVGGTAKKIYTSLAGRPVWTYAAERFAERVDVARVLVVIAAEDRDLFERQRVRRMDVATNPEIWRRIEVVIGGEERVDSIRNAMERLGVPRPATTFAEGPNSTSTLDTANLSQPANTVGTTNSRDSTNSMVDDEIGWVAIHDAARPCVTTELIDRVFDAARRTGAAIPVVPVVATLKRVRTSSVAGTNDAAVTDSTEFEWCGETVSREDLREAQTPQVFELGRLATLYAEFAEEETPQTVPTDDAQLFEKYGIPIAMVRGSSWNLKITTSDDLRLAQAIVQLEEPFGYTVPTYT